MNPGLVRLLLFNSRRACVRICAITVGIAVGMAGLLLLAGAYQGLHDRDAREVWLHAGTPVDASDAAAVTGDRVLTRYKLDAFRGEDVGVLEVAAGAQSTVRIPGLSDVPEPGAYVPSPALAALIDRDGGLGARYGGHRDGVLPQSVLASPDSMIVVVGVEPQALLDSGQAREVTTFAVPYVSRLAWNNAVRTVVALGAIGILLPVILLVSVVTQLGLAERHVALSTLRLIGAPRSIIGRIAVLEAAVTAVAGSLLGVVLAAVARPWAARVEVDKGSFYPADLELPPVVVALCCLVVVAVVVASAARRAAKARIEATGAARQQAEQEPTPWRLSLLVAGVATFALVAVGTREGWLAEGVPASLALIAGFLATSFGIMLAGPYVTHLAGAWASRTTGSAVGLIAAGRIISAPRATFRSVSGLVVAVFMVSVFAAAASAGAPDDVEEGPGMLPLNALVMWISQPSDSGTVAGGGAAEGGAAGEEEAAVDGGVAAGGARSGSDRATVDGDPSGELAPALDTLAAVPGVTGVSVAYWPAAGSGLDAVDDESYTWVVAAPEAAALGLGGGDASARYQSFVATDYLAPARPARPVAASPGQVGEPAALIVRTDGSVAAIERARTAMELARPEAMVPLTRSERAGQGGNQILAQLYAIAGVGVFVAIAIAGCTLAISTVAAILDRRRLLGMMRLMGTPVRAIRRAIAYEAALPLAATLLASVALGFGVAWFIVVSLSTSRPTTPSPQYFLALGAGLFFAVAVIAASLTAVRPATGAETTRYE